MIAILTILQGGVFIVGFALASLRRKQRWNV